MPIYVIGYFLIENERYGGRKRLLLYNFSLCSTFSFFCYFFTTPNELFFIFVSIVKFSITLSFAVLFTFTTESYPTSIRAKALGFLNAFSRLGGVCMPILCSWFYALGPTGPFFLFFIVSAISLHANMKIKKDTTNVNMD